jgi:hypothetical protein
MSTSRWKRFQYHQRRRALISKLGGCCVICGSIDHLELDHPLGRDWIANKQNLFMRIKLYEADYTSGNLRLLCRTCNVCCHHHTLPF